MLGARKWPRGAIRTRGTAKSGPFRYVTRMNQTHTNQARNHSLAPDPTMRDIDLHSAENGAVIGARTPVHGGSVAGWFI